MTSMQFKGRPRGRRIDASSSKFPVHRSACPGCGSAARGHSHTTPAGQSYGFGGSIPLERWGSEDSVPRQAYGMFPPT